MRRPLRASRAEQKESDRDARNRTWPRARIDSPDGGPHKVAEHLVSNDIPLAAIGASDASVEAIQRLLPETPTESAFDGAVGDDRQIPLDLGLSPAVTADGALSVAVTHELRPFELGQAQPRETKAAAEQSIRMQPRFLAAASHDLRQPLQAICLLHGLLKERVADPRARATLTKLEYAVDYMTGLLDTLLDIDQLEEGGLTPEFTDFPLSSLLDSAASEFAPVAAAKGLKLRRVSSSVVIHSDRRLLTRMIGNLLSNAITSTDHGKVLLGCRRRGQTLRIEVWDTGIGIPLEKFDAMLEELYRTDRTDAANFRPGLGLYIVQCFGQILGHKIEVHSEPGRGTRFAIVVPGVDFAAPALKGSEAKEDEVPSAPTVLLVEDDAAQPDSLRDLLELEAYRVLTVHNGSDALARLRAWPVVRPSLVMVDENLPGAMPSIDIILRLRDELKYDVPGLIVTAQGPSEDLARSKDNGIVVIAKPAKPADLISAVDALIESAFPRLHRINPLPEEAQILPSARVSAADIAIVDGEPGIRDAFRAMLAAERYRVETFASAEAFLSDAGHCHFRCLIVNLTLPGADGLQLQSRLRFEQLSPPIIFVTGQSDLPIAVKAMRAGAADVLQKPVHAETLRESIARALRDSHQTVNDRIERENVAARIATLTMRERQVMERILAGQLNKNIAAELGISRRTTEHHRQSVFRKMGTKSLAMLVRMVGPRDGNG
jgi:two-component system CheB/CheR fusion protein